MERGKRREGKSVTLETTPKEGSVSPWPLSSTSISNSCPLHYVGLPHSCGSNAVQWAFVAKKPVLGMV